MARGGQGLDLIVLLKDHDIEAEARASRLARRLPVEDRAILDFKATRYRLLKAQVLATQQPEDLEILRDYSHLPMAHVRFRDNGALLRFLAREEVEAVYPDERLVMHLDESLPLMGQPAAAAIVDRRGAGTAVAVLDTGVDYTKPAFGCTAPGVPAGTCKVVYAQDFAPDDGSRDADGHGSNVAAIAVGVAPDAKIVALDVFDGGGASSSDIIAAINWVISHRTDYNITAINLSLGGTTKYTTACSQKTTNPYRTPIINARSAGIITVASAGNSGWTDGIAMPACTPEAVSVGALYDGNLGSRAWVIDPATGATCNDSTTAADKVTCFSNDASFMTLFAPGALITAAGLTYGGTSQAAPHVAGALAALAGAYPGETPDQLIVRLTSRGTNVTDSRNGISHPRPNLAAAFDPGPANDLFAGAAVLSGKAGQTAGSNVGATREVGEPAHGGDVGGRSVWWQWSAPVSGLVSMDTHGSGFNTLLAVYTGGALGSLAAIAANDDDGTAGGASGLSFNTTAGSVYRIAVDGKDGATGGISLNWALRQPQSISFPPIADAPAGGGIALTATSSSGLAVGYASLTPSVCVVQSNTTKLLAGGVCTIEASQAGDASWLPAPAVSRTFTVTMLSQTIAFPPLADRELGMSPFAAIATASSGLPVEIASQTPAVCSSDHGLVTLLATGTCTLLARQEGDAMYAAADAVAVSFAVLAPARDGDVPLPPWSLLLLGSGLYALLARRR